MSARVIDMTTRRAREPEAVPVVCVDDVHEHTRLLRNMRNIMVDAESLGVSWATLRGWLVTCLLYVDAKIAQGKK